jgi:putative PIN family toxin of toxin-antitoxin system
MPARKRVTLVVDVNVLVSMLINQDTAGIKGLFDQRVFRVVVSPGHLAELEDVLLRPQFRRYFTKAEAERALQRIRNRSHSVKTEFQVRPISRDPKDDYLLALAKVSKADVLITGDDDLLVLKKYGKTRILKPAAFRKEFL